MFRRFRIAVDDFANEGEWVGPDGVKCHIFSAADLVKYHWLEVPATSRARHRLEAEYYCGNARCGMREVCVSMKGERRSPPALVCPACRESLTFHHFLKDVPLLPVEPGNPSPSPAVPEPSLN